MKFAHAIKRLSRNICVGEKLLFAGVLEQEEFRGRPAGFPSIRKDSMPISSGSGNKGRKPREPKSDSSCASSAVQELVLGLSSTSGRTQLIIIGGSTSPEPFRTNFQQVTCVPTADSGEGINGHEIHGLANESTIVLCLVPNESLPKPAFPERLPIVTIAMPS